MIIGSSSQGWGSAMRNLKVLAWNFTAGQWRLTAVEGYHISWSEDDWLAGGKPLGSSRVKTGHLNNFNGVVVWTCINLSISHMVSQKHSLLSAWKTDGFWLQCGDLWFISHLSQYCRSPRDSPFLHEYPRNIPGPLDYSLVYKRKKQDFQSPGNKLIFLSPVFQYKYQHKRL